MPSFINISGSRFGMWTVGTVYQDGRWKCACDCGTVRMVMARSLLSGRSISCGCRFRKHGMDGTKIYRLWCHMRERCVNPNYKSFKRYGGRGVSVCAEWEGSFVPFYKWALENGYDEKLTIDRIDVNGNYCPENCRFATNKQQQNNRTNNHRVTINGETKTLSEWAEFSGIGKATIRYRTTVGIAGIELLKPTKKGGD